VMCDILRLLHINKGALSIPTLCALAWGSPVAGG